MKVNNLCRHSISLCLLILFSTLARAQSTLLIDEDFALFQSTSRKDVSKQLDQYTRQPGWSGLRVYIEKGKSGQVTVGGSSSGTDGFIVTPPFTATTGAITVCVEVASVSARAWDGITVALAEPDGLQYILKPDTRLYMESADITTNFDSYYITLYYDAPCRVRIDPNKNAYIRCIKVWDGTYTATSISGVQSSPNRPSRPPYPVTGNIVIMDGKKYIKSK